MFSCDKCGGSGRSPRRVGWDLRGPRGDPRGGRHVDHEVLPEVFRHARADSAALAVKETRRSALEGAVVAASAVGSGGAGGQACAGHPAWGHRKVWAMVRHEGHVVSEATILRLLRDEGLLILPAEYQRERRKLAECRNAASRPGPPGRTRSGSWPFRSSRPPAAGPGG
ncbi:transposase [Actinopolymorpha alba]|uniref:transposase n=1 Tax=Actinopolymorpha alba TaxID=533267 RepID=UPI003B5111C3